MGHFVGLNDFMTKGHWENHVMERMISQLVITAV